MDFLRKCLYEFLEESQEDFQETPQEEFTKESFFTISEGIPVENSERILGQTFKRFSKRIPREISKVILCGFPKETHSNLHKESLEKLLREYLKEAPKNFLNYHSKMLQKFLKESLNQTPGVISEEFMEKFFKESEENLLKES